MISPLGSLSILAFACEAVQDSARALRLLPRLTAQRGRVGVVRHIQILGPVDLFVGMCLCQLGRWEEATSVPDASTAQVSVVDPATGTVATTITVGNGPTDATDATYDAHANRSS